MRLVIATRYLNYPCIAHNIMKYLGVLRRHSLKLLISWQVHKIHIMITS
jgi:hypothetical protein